MPRQIKYGCTIGPCAKTGSHTNLQLLVYNHAYMIYCLYVHSIDQCHGPHLASGTICFHITSISIAHVVHDMKTNNGNESINRKESKLKTHLVLATPGGLHVICLCSRLQPLPTKHRNAAQEVGGRMLVVGVSTPIQLVLEDQLFSRFLFSLLFHVPSVFMNINNFTVRGDC